MSPRETMPAPTDRARIGRSVSLDDAAERLGVSRRTIYNRIRRGRLQTVRTLGGSQRVLVDSIEQAMRTTGGTTRSEDPVFIRLGWETEPRQ